MNLYIVYNKEELQGYDAYISVVVSAIDLYSAIAIAELELNTPGTEFKADEPKTQLVGTSALPKGIIHKDFLSG